MAAISSGARSSGNRPFTTLSGAALGNAHSRDAIGATLLSTSRIQRGLGFSSEH
jgi:hypothetical protein